MTLKHPAEARWLGSELQMVAGVWGGSPVTPATWRDSLAEGSIRVQEHRRVIEPPLPYKTGPVAALYPLRHSLSTVRMTPFPSKHRRPLALRPCTPLVQYPYVATYGGRLP